MQNTFKRFISSYLLLAAVLFVSAAFGVRFESNNLLFMIPAAMALDGALYCFKSWWKEE